MLIDSHCHLDRLDLKPYQGDLSLLVEAARERGVTQIMCVSIGLDNVADVIATAQRFPQVVAAVGLHPLDVSNGLMSGEQLAHWAQREKVVAIGETGLDYYYVPEDDLNNRAQQKESFVVHLQTGAHLGLPVIVHTRDARQDTIALIQEYGDLNHGGVLHCFTEDWTMACKAMDLLFDLYLWNCDLS